MRKLRFSLRGYNIYNIMNTACKKYLGGRSVLCSELLRLSDIKPIFCTAVRQSPEGSRLPAN
jgi:hypothetical protein